MSAPTRLRRERALGDWLRARLPSGVAVLALFIVKQGWSALFGGLLLIGLIASDRYWPDAAPLARYDALLIYAISLQALFLALRLESWREVKVIFLFHLTGTVMEIFKTHMGSWAYPEPSLIRVGDVPLFSGFMYGAVGSYMARVMRVFDMRFDPYPPYWVSVALAGAIYVNFFSHHYVWDARWILIAGTLLIFGRTRVSFAVDRGRYWMPMPLAGVLTAFFLWVAENVGTSTNTWLYNGQSVFDAVSLSKMGSWYLLLWVSFATVTLVIREPLITPDRATAKRPAKAAQSPAG